jgi:hypothetical protein
MSNLTDGGGLTVNGIPVVIGGKPIVFSRWSHDTDLEPDDYLQPLDSNWAE